MIRTGSQASRRPPGGVSPEIRDAPVGAAGSQPPRWEKSLHDLLMLWEDQRTAMTRGEAPSMTRAGGRIGRAVTATAAGLLLLLPAFDRPAPAGASTSFEAI